MMTAHNTGSCLQSKELCQKLGLMYQPFTEGTEGSDWVVVDAGRVSGRDWHCSPHPALPYVLLATSA